MLALFAVLFLVGSLPQFWDWRIMGAPSRFVVWWIPLIGTIYLNVEMFRQPKTRGAR